MGIKWYAATSANVPEEMFASIFGAVDCGEDGTQYTPAFDNKEKLVTLIGTLQTRMERAGQDFDGAWILPYGTQVPQSKTKPKVRGPLKARLDYGTLDPFPILEMRPVHDGIYAAEQEPVSPDAIAILPNCYYPKGLTMGDILSYNAQRGNQIISQYRFQEMIHGNIGIKSDDNAMLMRNASQDILHALVGDGIKRLNPYGRTIEFRHAANFTTDQIWIEVEAGDLFPWSETKRITSDLYAALSCLDDVTVISNELVFSGKNGFYVYAHLTAPLSIESAKEIADKVIGDYIAHNKDGRIVNAVISDPESIRLDSSTMRLGGGLRVAHSLCYPTGLVCVPMTPQRLHTFEKTMAKIEQDIDLRGADFTYNPNPTLMKYNLSQEEMDAVHKWLKHEGKLGATDIKLVLDLRDRIGGPDFVWLVRDFVGNPWLTAPTIEDKWLMGLRALQDIPKYQAAMDNEAAGLGETDWKEFAEKHRFVPYNINEYVEKYRIPYLAAMPEGAVDSIYEAYEKMDPYQFQKYLDIVLGLVIPMQSIEGFMGMLKELRPRGIPVTEASEYVPVLWGMLASMEKHYQMQGKNALKNDAPTCYTDTDSKSEE